MANEQKCKQCGSTIYFEGICDSCQAENEKDRFLSLTDKELENKIQKIYDEIEETGGMEKFSQIFTKLLNYRNINTSKIAEIAFEKELFNPWEIYKDTPEQIKKKMLDMIMQDDLDIKIAYNLLGCLAICGGDEVQKTFWYLEKHPKKWQEGLYSPSSYATYGGWTYDTEGRIVNTIFDKCFPMISKTIEDKEYSPVKIGVKTNEKCTKCGCKIVNIMEIDGKDPRLNFLGIDGIVKAKFCLNCFAFSDAVFCKYEINGESMILHLDEHEDEDEYEDYLKTEGIEELCSNTYVLGNKPVPLRYAADWNSGSSIGGHAFWLQFSDIKSCQCCGKPMKYLAQVDLKTVMDDMEGYAYIEICKDCNIMAIVHQMS